MSRALRLVYRIGSTAAAFAFICQVQPAAAQLGQTVAFTITNAAGETAVPPGCPPSRLSFLNPLRLTRGSLPARDYFCYTNEDDVRGIAAYYAPYAIQAALSYYPITDDGKSLTATINQVFPGQSDHVEKLLHGRGWHFEFADRCLTLEACGANYQLDPSGLAFQIWSRTNAQRRCHEVSVAFRGSILSIASWGSNLEQQLPGFDSEYKQLKRDFNAVLKIISAKVPCKQTVTVGHSLGGGLATFAALAASPPRQIAKVITFNTSPVDGVNLVEDTRLLSANVTGLTIDRVNQQGDVLSRNFFKKRRQTRGSVCDPLIRGVEFNATGWSIPILSDIQGHEILPLTSKLVELSYKDGDPVKPKLPPVGRGAPCNTQYYEDQTIPASEQGAPVARIDGHGPYAFVDAGFVVPQPRHHGPIYAYAADHHRLLGKLGSARTHKRVAQSHRHLGSRIHAAHS